MLSETLTLHDQVLVARFIEEEPRVHPNGFIQLNLDERHDRRLHVWHPSIPSQGINSVHDHVFDMRSRVVAGEMVNRTYLITKDWREEFNTHVVWNVEYAPGSFEATLRATEETCFLELDRREVIKAGETYWLPAGVPHVADNSEFCATVMTREKKHKKTSYVYLPHGHVPTPFTRTDVMPTEQMWQIIWEVLDW